jgi:putative aldouronate transport system permease protein
MFSDPAFLGAFKNTFKISILKLLITFPAPLILALLINEVRHSGYRRVVQTFTYLPHFISWVILGGLIKSFLSPETGAMNQFLASLGFEKIQFMYEPDWFMPILLVAELWKGAGWGSIIYLASIMGIDGSMYEAAEIDGCSRLGKVIYITIPSIMPTVAMQLVLSIANVMNAGFDSIYNLYNPATESVAETIDTLAYKTFLKAGEWELSSAIGLFKTSINFVLMIGGNIATKKMTGYSMYSFDN